MPNKRGKPIGVGMTPSKTDFGSFIRARRIKLHMDQKSLARESGYIQNVISLIEIGKQKRCNGHHLKKLAKTLKCKESDLRKLMPAESKPKTKVGELILSKQGSLSLKDFARKNGLNYQRIREIKMSSDDSEVYYRSFRLLTKILNLDPISLTRIVSKKSESERNELGILIRSHRWALGMSIVRLSEKTGIKKQALSQIELGRYNLKKKNSDWMIKNLASALKLDVATLEALRPKKRSL